MKKNDKNGKTDRISKGEERRDVGAEIRRWSVAALAGLALGTAAASSEVGANFEGAEGDAEGSAALEEAFFETLGRCESPLLNERNRAEDALFGRFAGFESIWQDRRFLTNGEIGAEARQRFELVEARYREKAFEECGGAFETTLEALEPEPKEGEKRGVEGKNDERTGENEKKGGNRKSEGNEGNKKNDEKEGNEEILRGRVRLRWKKPLRIVYLSPDWSAFERRGVDGNRWRPSGRFSAPELAPEFDASELTFETIWERVDGEDASTESKNGNNASPEGRSGENGENGENGEGGAAVVGVLEGLVGGDFRVWTLPLVRVAIENAENGADRKDRPEGLDWGDKADGESWEDWGDREDERKEGKRDATSGVGDDFPSVFQSGDAVATVGETTIKPNGTTTARVRFDFAEAFDAFDSHRVWCDKEDFELVIDERVENLNSVFGFGVANEGEATRTKAKKNATGATGRRWAAIRLRVRERSATGALFELDFPNDAALRKAVAQGRARLACRIPRFFFWTRFEIAGIEKRNDGGKFDEDNEKMGVGAPKTGNK